MDPGISLLEHIKTIPNLINEDPSIVTPKCVSFSHRPWTEHSIPPEMAVSSSGNESCDSSDKVISETSCLGNWDGMTTFQDFTASKQ